MQLWLLFSLVLDSLAVAGQSLVAVQVGRDGAGQVGAGGRAGGGGAGQGRWARGAVRCREGGGGAEPAWWGRGRWVGAGQVGGQVGGGRLTSRSAEHAPPDVVVLLGC